MNKKPVKFNLRSATAHNDHCLSMKRCAACNTRFFTSTLSEKLCGTCSAECLLGDFHSAASVRWDAGGESLGLGGPPLSSVA